MNSNLVEYQGRTIKLIVIRSRAAKRETKWPSNRFFLFYFFWTEVNFFFNSKKKIIKKAKKKKKRKKIDDSADESLDFVLSETAQSAPSISSNSQPKETKMKITSPPSYLVFTEFFWVSSQRLTNPFWVLPSCLPSFSIVVLGVT